ncbi:MAG: glycosyltransferase family 9 protein [Bacteroidia bacterium]|nr:glycosyltransferase family 9 protein [Bacteroidia bacterium]
MRAYKNILIIQTAFIGDAILASSLLEKLHAEFPEAQLSILVRKGNEGIYHQHPFLKEVLVWDKTQNKMKHLWQLLFRVRKNRYDCVINCHRFASSGVITGFSGALHSAGYKQNPFSFLFNFNVKHIIGDGRHETERYAQLVEDFAGPKVYKPRLYPSAADFEKVKNYQQHSYVCMAPASVWFTKQLPEKKWTELCNKTENTLTIYLLGAPGDVALCERIKNTVPNKNVVVLAGKLNLLESCALMSNANMNYVNDSAPLHLASAVNAPVTAFFVSTVPAFGFGPLSDNSQVKEVHGLDCRPCGLHGFKACPKQHFKCGENMVL